MRKWENTAVMVNTLKLPHSKISVVFSIVYRIGGDKVTYVSNFNPSTHPMTSSYDDVIMTSSYK